MDTKVPFPFEVNPRADVHLIFGLDLIHLFQIQIPLMNQDEVRTSLAAFRTDPIDKILDHAQEKVDARIAAHPQQALMMEQIKAELQANALTAKSHSTLGPIAIRFKNPADRSRTSWRRQHDMSPERQALYQKQVNEWSAENIVEEHLIDPLDLDDNGIPAGNFNT